MLADLYFAGVHETSVNTPVGGEEDGSCVFWCVGALGRVRLCVCVEGGGGCRAFLPVFLFLFFFYGV